MIQAVRNWNIVCEKFMLNDEMAGCCWASPLRKMYASLVMNKTPCQVYHNLHEVVITEDGPHEKEDWGWRHGICSIFDNRYSSMHAAPPACLTMTYRWGCFWCHCCSWWKIVLIEQIDCRDEIRFVGRGGRRSERTGFCRNQVWEGSDVIEGGELGHSWSNSTLFLCL